MSYVKTNWQNGVTPLNAQNMNHIEDGIAANDTNITNVNTRVNNVKNDVQQLSGKLPTIMLLDIQEEDV